MTRITRTILLIFLVALFVSPLQAQTTNLLANPSFEGGTHEQSGISGVLPNEWDISWKDSSDPLINPNVLPPTTTLRYIST